MTGNRRGVALLEVLMALALLGSAGLALVALVQGGLADVHRAVAEEASLGTASRVLTALTLLTREELDQRLGQRRIGEFAIDLQRPERGLYRIAVARWEAPGLPLLVTVVYRP